MSKLQKGLLYLAVSLFLSGCIPLQYTSVDIDVYEPPEFMAGKEYKKIAIIYKNPTELEDSLKREFMNIIPDSFHTQRFMQNAVADRHILVLTDFLASTGYFDTIVSLPDAPSMISDIDTIVFKIELSEISRYKSEFPDLDLLLSLELFFTQRELIFIDDIQYFEMWIFTSTVWKLCDLSMDSVCFFRPKIDTLIWQGSAKTSKGIKQLVNMEMSILEGAEESAVALGKYVAPHWETVSRLLYVSQNYELKKAQQFVKVNQWKEAAEIWEQFANSKNPKIAAKASYNLAVASEIDGNIPAARDWLLHSHQILINDKDIYFEHITNVVNYLNVLSKRETEIEKLDKMNLPGGL
ncbi:MAG: tetratricopeptide repeat protein [Prolixibacteraceae bacterium]|nr:tetratricopeptide repeat protein [Prolixibacteraceae bacterium]